ncbi:phosphoribosyltransferase family protein [Streptomyces sp. TRM76323]|uniref:Phosphoribosyltransferase family protein n=1 Tax=Streptomyces tamarix TaxID=3078565 RepID=A0ABU3QV19_9ACTN|nr:phosphoribosyltransferase family protein [Streptomyces tamarix]MDT9686601.1 phosphoribosyltransferase family protein [Streptomyces tamarix]
MAVAAARELRRTGVAVRVAPVLRQCRAVADQAGLDARRRQENLAGALAVVPGGARLLEGARVVLVDDLMTTGSSLAEAARALGDAGAGVLPGGAACAFAAEGGGAACRFAAGDGDGASAERVASGRWNGGDSAMEPGSFGTRTPDSGRRHDVLPRDGLGSLLVGAAVVGASPKAFGINRN